MLNINMKNIIGYAINADDNDTEMYPRESTAVPKCAACGYRTEFFPHNPDYVFKKTFKPIYPEDKFVVSPKTSDWTLTYDGQVIVTYRFKDFCEKQKYRGLQFLGFKNDEMHFHLIPTQEIEVDLEKCNMRYEKYCSVCGLYQSIVPSPEYYKISEPLPDGISRSDLIIGGPHGRVPMHIVGAETAQKIKEVKFKGFLFRPIYGL